jgi:hypothetical protein
MTATPEPPAREPTPQEIGELLRRVLENAEESKRKRWVEYTVAIVLALTTTASAWCAYQAARWRGVQTFKLAAANRAGREATSLHHAALQTRMLDAEMFLAFTAARLRGDDKFAEFLHQRFRPEARTAVDAWLRAEQARGPDAPKHPFQMPEYVQHELQEAKEFEHEAGEMTAAAERANETSDRYVLLTVLFATVLFFGGITSTMRSRRLRIVLTLLTLIQFVVTFIVLATMPYCRE